MSSLIILSAFFLDLVFGDPSRLPHPVRAIGWTVQQGEGLFRRFVKTPRSEKIAGIVLVIAIVSATYLIAQSLILASSRFSAYLGFGISVIFAYTALAARDLAGSAYRVLNALKKNDLIRARKELSMIVGRDTENLNEQEISRAVVETVAENTSDGVIAPLFYLVLGGPALALAYKAVNTMDSMIGYKNVRYISFGWAAARLDDAANYLPARITAVLICLAANLQYAIKAIAPPSPQPFPPARESDSAFDNPKAALGMPWHVMLRDCRNHPSPNSGWPESAMAGALGVRLGGPSSYGGITSVKPCIGNEGGVLDNKSIEKSVVFMYCSSLLAVGIACLAAFVIN